MDVIKRLARVLPVLVFSFVCNSKAMAGNDHANTVYFGLGYLQNQAQSPALSGYNTPPGLHLNVGNASVLGMNLVHSLSGPWSFELDLGVPPTVTTYAYGQTWSKLGIAPGTAITKVDVMGPTAFVNYNFSVQDEKWSPFVGVGLNYVIFTHRHALSSLTNRLGPTKIDLTNSWGPAVHVGLIYRFDKNWSLATTLSYADVQSDLTSTTYSTVTPGLVTAQGKTHLNFHPTVLMMGLGYGF